MLHHFKTLMSCSVLSPQLANWPQWVKRCRRDRGVRGGAGGAGRCFGDLASSCQPRHGVSLEGWIRGGQGGGGHSDRRPSPAGLGRGGGQATVSLSGLPSCISPPGRITNPLQVLVGKLRPESGWGFGRCRIAGGQCDLGRRQWHPTPILLPGKSHGWRSLVGCSPWGSKESGTTERLHFHFSLSCTGEGNGSPLQYSCLENTRDGSLVGCHLWGHTDLAAAAEV